MPVYACSLIGSVSLPTILKGSNMNPSLADQLSAVLTYRNTPDHTPEPIQSSWSVVPANDNAPLAKREGVKVEKLVKVTPSVEDIQRAMRGDWVWNGEGRLVAIGHLRFSDGKQTEPAMVRMADGTVERQWVRVRAGAMLGCTETITDEAGGKSQNVTISNAAFTERLGLPSRKFIPANRRRKGKSLTSAESRALIDAAIANTAIMPPVTKCPPGVASGTAQYSDQFIGMKIGSTGRGGLIQWVDLYVAGLEHQQWMDAVRSLDAGDAKTLDRAMTAQNLSDMGRSGHRRSRERQAVRRLLAANDNLIAAVKRRAA